MKSVRSILEESGLREVEAGSFCGAYVRRGWFTSLAFLAAKLGEESAEPDSISALVEEARLWCKEHVRATWFVRECGLNLVLFHEGQISRDLIADLPDVTGMHAAILQSVTAIDTRRSTVLQAKTWIVIGTARRVVRSLASVDEGAT